MARRWLRRLAKGMAKLALLVGHGPQEEDPAQTVAVASSLSSKSK